MPTVAGFSTVENIAGMFPTFQRGISQQKPADTLIVQFGADVQSQLRAVLQRRFGEAIAAAPYNGTYSLWEAALSADALNILELVNRQGAAVQLGETLASFGVAGARDLSKMYR